MFKRALIIVLLAIILFLAVSNFLSKEKPSYQAEVLNANEQNIKIGKIDLLVDIADESNERAQGLSGRDKMAENKGMLFIFPQPGSYDFWMKDMLFSLDMVWVDAAGTIVAITKDISPDTFPKTFEPPSPIKYVIEVNSGWSDRNNVKVGDKVSF